MVSTGCDQNGFVLGYDVCAGNVHDAVSFWPLYKELKKFEPSLMVMDAGYKTPAIIRKLVLDGVAPLTPRVDPKTGEGFFYKYEYVYDEKNDCYICPGNHTLQYSTTNRTDSFVKGAKGFFYNLTEGLPYPERNTMVFSVKLCYNGVAVFSALLGVLAEGLEFLYNVRNHLYCLCCGQFF